MGIFEDDDDDAELVQASDEPSKEQIFDEDSNDSTPASVLKPLDGKSFRNSLWFFHECYSHLDVIFLGCGNEDFSGF